MRLKSKAHQKLRTSKCSSSLDATKMIDALITNKNNPNEKIVIGMVSTTRIGLRNALRNARTDATNNAEKKSRSLTPGSRYAVIKTAIVEISSLISMFFIKKNRFKNSDFPTFTADETSNNYWGAPTDY
jgi:hypothetical protein